MVRLHAGTYVQGTEGVNALGTISQASRRHPSLVPAVVGATWPAPLAGSVETSLNLTNPLGYAEHVSLGVEHGSQATNIYTLALTKPKPWGRSLLLDARLHQLGHNYQGWSSYVELVRGGALTLSR